MSYVRRVYWIATLVALASGTIACAELEPVEPEGEASALTYASAAGAAGSSGFSVRRTASIDAESPHAADELVAHALPPAIPGSLTTVQRTQQVDVSWSCDNGRGGKNSGTCNITGIISAKACVNTIKAKCPTRSVHVSW